MVKLGNDLLSLAKGARTGQHPTYDIPRVYAIMAVVFQLADVVAGAQRPPPGGEGVIHTGRTEHELQTTANFAPRNRFITWFTGGLNFQVEYHLFPYISHLHYPAHRAHRATDGRRRRTALQREAQHA